ncbi:MAG TPA: hypothetical protein VF269_01535 [Rhodanobacteraceae bacterium]
MGFLLAGVAVLVALALWQWRSERARATLLDIAPAAVTRIDVLCAGRATQHYVKRKGQWYRQGTSLQRVDDARLAALAALAATPVLQWRALATVDVAKIGLAAPPISVRLNGHTLAYGALAAFGPQRFVRVGDRIAVIPASYSPRVPKAFPASASSSQKS